MVYQISESFKLIITNNIKCGYICDCETHTVEHLLFQCKSVKNIGRILWQKVIDKMPIPMIEEFNSRITREKVIYNIYSCSHGEPVREWLEIYRALVEFVCFTNKYWYEI